MKKHIIVCADNETLLQPLCDYGVYLANATGLPLMFLNVVEPLKNIEINLAGNLILGDREDLLEEFVAEEEKESRIKIKEGKKLLESMRARAGLKTTNEIVLKQFHGGFIETLQELTLQARVFVVGLQSAKKGTIGTQVTESIKHVDTPFFLVSGRFKEPKSVLIDTNGSKEALKLIHNIANDPLFGTLQRDIVAIDTDEQKTSLFLKEAEEIFHTKKIPVTTHAIQGSAQEKLLDFFEQNDYDILARGAFTKSLLKELFFGSVTKEILNKTNKPLLLIK
ncbi:MAG: universal stress protein [Sulfurimonadaceae bacterium]|jgi:nucleotide-binding universal stress UspA family protein|nr:universal stress protein [Sulfurimonadaceae bacterium]